MKVLVANLGSTSFKYRLFDMVDERQLARGAVERIGSQQSRCSVEIGPHTQETVIPVSDHAQAVRQCLAQLTDPACGCLSTTSDVAAIGFKAVHGGAISGVVRVDQSVLQAMEEMNAVAPAHNPPYIRAMRIMAEQLPEIPLIAAFETGFHQSVPAAWKHYAVPRPWADQWSVRKHGFHGASHRYIAERMIQLTGRPHDRIVSCHLGGSSSLCAIRDGKSVATTMGMSPQSGLPQNNRIGDFDPFALPLLMQRTGKSLDEVLQMLSSQSGLLGLSGLSGDVRDLEEAAADGNASAQLALDVFIAEARRHLGGMIVALGGLDTLVFTGGIGENSRFIRQAICADLDELGIKLDARENERAGGESSIHGDSSRAEIWVVPTNEEIIVARQTAQLLQES